MWQTNKFGELSELLLGIQWIHVQINGRQKSLGINQSKINNYLLYIADYSMDLCIGYPTKDRLG